MHILTERSTSQPTDLTIRLSHFEAISALIRTRKQIDACPDHTVTSSFPGFTRTHHGLMVLAVC